jgi:hypothetical protein
MREKKSVTRVIASRYQNSNKKEKGKILEEFVELTGYTRSYASYLLGSHGKRRRITSNVVIVGDVGKKTKRNRDKIYDSRVLDALKKIWFIMDCICGKRLAPMLHEVIGVLKRFGEIEFETEVREKLLNVSPATIDRLLVEERKKQTLRGRAKTKPGTLLKHKIPIRMFSQWDDKRPGFVEMDLVGHEGGDSVGDYIRTLKQIRERLPFSLLGIDSDNGGEFINDQLYRYYQSEQITFTRGRPYRKNDGCYVEQKNYSVVRRAVDYLRYDTVEQLDLRLYTNYFQPVMKLIEKTRIGSRVRKKHDKPKTPFRVTQCGEEKEKSPQN